MELHLKVSLVCICGLLCFQCVSCEGSLEVSKMLSWRCLCEANPEGVVNYTPSSNCSSSCNCVPDEVEISNSGVWNCSCASDGAADETYGSIRDASCFTSCNCTSGSPRTPTTDQKRAYSKGVIAILLSCVALTTTALIVSVACHFYRKDKFSGQSPMFSPDKESSWNSATNLISHRSASFPEWQRKSGSSHKSLITAFIERLLLTFRSERGTFPGSVIQFSFVELEQATEKFSKSNLIGLGGSSSVYRGRLRDGRIVAVKKLQLPGGAEDDYGFLTEIELISRLNHCHVVPLIGFCSEYRAKQFERLLVFEFMSNGNLRECLDATHHGKVPMDWPTRVSIALGVARGLEYLHESAAPRILHRDIKSTNILLDDKYRAKITDLGMAKRLMNDDPASCSSSPARMLGTFGYFAPEYAIVGKASLKSDVFSFGVVILELISGRQPIHKSPNKCDESLVIWATARMRDNKSVVVELPDPLLGGKFPEEEMRTMARLARECLQWDPDSRPTMSEVVQVLSTIAPDKSRSKYSPSGLFTSSVIRDNSRKLDEIERPAALSSAGHARCSLPLTLERNLCWDPQKNEDTVLPTMKHTESLNFLMSPSRSWRRTTDEDTVDLTEPRYESFVQINLNV